MQKQREIIGTVREVGEHNVPVKFGKYANADRETMGPLCERERIGHYDCKICEYARADRETMGTWRDGGRANETVTAKFGVWSGIYIYILLHMDSFGE